jgi:hypothetical protein
VAAVEGPTERASLADQRIVADDLVDRPGAHSSGQRLAAQRRHEGGLLLAGVQGRGADGTACCHEAMLQVGRFER